MSVFITPQIRNPAPQKRGAPELNGLFRRLLDAVARDWQRRRMIRALHAMDDWLLRDIGIDRGNIEEVVDGFDRRELSMTPVARASATVEIDQEAFRKAA